MHIWKSLANLGVGVVSAILLVTAIVVMSLTRAFRSGMIDIKPELFLHLAATTIAIVALWKLFAGDRVIAKRLGAMALAGLLLANVPLKLPGTWSLGEAKISEADYANARSADALLVAKAVPCDTPHFKADGSHRYWWSPKEDGTCYDRAGKGLQPADSEEIFDMLARQRAKAKHIEVVVAVPLPPVPSPVAVVVSASEATPVVLPQPQPPQPLISEPQIVSARPWSPPSSLISGPQIVSAQWPKHLGPQPLPPQAEQQ